MSIGQNKELYLVGDIGGTNARFALVYGDGLPVQIQTLPCADYEDLAAAVQAYLHSAGDVQPTDAALAVATPILGDEIRFTNNHWVFSTEATRQKLGLRTLKLLNDFTALALSLPHLPAEELQQIGGQVAVPNTAIALIGPGTGLGVSGLIPNGQGGWIPIQGEGGHVTLAGNTERELQILAIMQQHNEHVSAERLLSGFGLPGFYRAVAQLQGVPAQDLQPSEIAERGVQGTCPVCQEVMQTFCALLGGVTGNLALTLGARGGVYLGGGILPKLGEYFLQSQFRERFEAKGRFTGYLQAIPVYLILSPYPALVGAAQALV